MAEVQRERRDNVAILTLNRPVANLLSPSLRAELQAELQAALTDDRVEALVLCGAGQEFSSGVDVTEYDAPLATPWVGDLCLQIEMSPKPVVAALHGVAVGGGFELALAAHARIAVAGTKVAMPEVELGLVPGGGATQRLPRIAGVHTAIDLLLSGRAVDVGDAVMGSLIDEIVPDAPVEAAVVMARDLAQSGDWRRAQDHSEGLSDPLGYQDAIAKMVEKRRDLTLAATEILRCIEAAQLLPYQRGLEMERAIFDERRVAMDARARRHFHMAERRTMILPERGLGRARNISHVAIPGDGVLVVELAVACLDAGLRVSLMADDVAATEAVRGRISAIYDGAVERNVLSRMAQENLLTRLSGGWPAEVLPSVDMVLDIGQTDLTAHHQLLNPSAIWVCVSDGGPMPVTAPRDIGDRAVDVRVYRPVLSTKLVEMCVPAGTSADAVVSVAQFFGRMGRTVIRCECVDGLVGGNMSSAFYFAALALANAGVGVYRIDAAARALGFTIGPFRLMDREGLPQVAERLHLRAAGHEKPNLSVLEAQIAAGALGRTTGRGFYFYDAKGVHPDPDLREGMNGTARPLRLEPRTALESALVNEAARLMSVNVVQRASDIDVVMVSCFGFDWSRGGPLFQADRRGIFNVLTDMKRCADVSGPLWQPHQLVEEMVKNGKGFFGRVAT